MAATTITTPGSASAVPAEPRARRKKPIKAIPTLPGEDPIAANSKRICLLLQEATRRTQQRNLDWAVQLAQQAAQHRGPLVAHFAELGRRFGETLSEPTPKPTLTVVKGGAA